MERTFHDLSSVKSISYKDGGRGIRTPGTVPRTVVFKTTGFNRSPIPPFREYQTIAASESSTRTTRQGGVRESRMDMDRFVGCSCRRVWLRRRGGWGDIRGL